ncbi:ParA family protein [Halomarina oriensis]|uniref:AAA family ATPase n=1 Tax=Halomarina oriensis TaxID=671145 RepID=A0A6B0GT31_9EURY|nr:ParA family protein [Halomarina oriensis]MWG36517.1 AAA family ATPase [Halomarina oriensis]
MQTIALAGQKGGIGKTTVAINIAGALNERGVDVLLVDLDPQGNATEGLGHNEAYTADGSTLFDVLVDGTPLDDVLVEHDELTLAPAHIDMLVVEKELTLAKRAYERVERALEDHAETARHDVAILDCPPSLGILSDSALLAADDLVIPALAESTSKRAIELLFDYQIDDIEEQYGRVAETRAVVANRIDTDGEAEAMVEWLHDAFEPAVPVFEIRKRVAIKRAWSAGGSIFAKEPECDMTGVFDRLATEVCEVAR